MSLRLSIIDAIYSAMNNGYEDEILNSTPRAIADDMRDHEIFSEDEYDKAFAIINEMRSRGDI